MKEDSDKDKKFLKELIVNAGNITTKALNTAQKSMSALEYVVTKYNDAPVLLPIENYDIIKQDNECEIIDIILFYYGDNKIIKYLSDVLIGYYRKNNKEDQSMWSTDCARLSYLIRTQIGDKERWVVDKKGVGLHSIAIKPLLAFIEKLCMDYLVSTDNSRDMNMVLKKKQCIEIIEQIHNNCMSSELIKYLAPFFNLNKSE
jgi:hypothetical protein